MWRLTGSQYLGTIVASWVGRVIAIGFIGWSVITPLLAGERPDPLTVAWMSLIAIMLWFSAGDAATHAKRARKMETYDLSQVIQRLSPQPGTPILRTLSTTRTRWAMRRNAPHRRPRPEGPALRPR